MSEAMVIIEGSDNVFADLGLPNAADLLMKAEAGLRPDDLLVMWHEVPDNLYIFLIPGDHMDRELFLQCNGVYVNCNNSDDDDEAINIVCERMHNEHLQDGDQNKGCLLHGKYSHYMVMARENVGDHDITGPTVVYGPRLVMIQTGMFL